MINTTTVLELVKRYRGDAKFDVKQLVEEDKISLITFMNKEYEGVKDEIMNAEVIRFTCLTKNLSVPTIEIVVKDLWVEEKEEPQPAPEPTTPPETSENQEENAGGEQTSNGEQQAGSEETNASSGE